jgi:peptidoglycan/xylan/chitin deacetylase (PgdA/CDA1 family)
MRRLLAHRHRLRALLPRRLRELAYTWHPGRNARWSRRPGIQRLPAGNHIVLTLDDGPDPDATPAVLDALAATGATATFFVLGEQVAAHPEIAARIVAEGHEIGLHGAAHFRHDRATAEASYDDLVQGLAQVESVTGVRPRFYRPPFGKLSDASERACRDLGLTPVYWSSWGLDWERRSGGEIASAVLRELDDGAIVLLHDSARYGRRPSAVPTAEAIPVILERARTLGLRPVSLADGAAVPAVS